MRIGLTFRFLMRLHFMRVEKKLNFFNDGSNFFHDFDSRCLISWNICFFFNFVLKRTVVTYVTNLYVLYYC